MSDIDTRATRLNEIRRAKEQAIEAGHFEEAARLRDQERVLQRAIKASHLPSPPPFNRLVDFLYILGREHLPLGIFEEIMWEQVDTEPSSYSNSYLEDYARNLAKRLTDDSVPITDWKHQYRSSDGRHRYRIAEDGTRTEDPRKFVNDGD